MLEIPFFSKNYNHKQIYTDILADSFQKKNMGPEAIKMQSWKSSFSNFSSRFLNPFLFFPIWILIVQSNVLDEQIEKTFCFKNCTDFSLF